MSNIDFSSLEFCLSNDSLESPAFNQSIEIYDPNEIKRRLETDETDNDFEESIYSHEEQVWRRRLKSLIRHPQRARRRLLIADEAMILRIHALKEVSPHFASVIDLVESAARLSHAAQSPLLVPPLLLVGPPGLGKTFFAQQLALSIGSYFEAVAMDRLSDHGTLTGLSLSWKAARIGRIADALLKSETASPVLLLDEVEKVNPIHFFEQPLAFLHSVLEPANARHFTDEYLTIEMRADYAIWIMTANSIDKLAPSILDRLMIVHIDEPTREQLIVVVKGIYTGVNERYNCIFANVPSDAVIDRLLDINPRAVRKVLEVAFGFAYANGLNCLSIHAIDRARLLFAGDKSASRSIGFL